MCTILLAVDVSSIASLPLCPNDNYLDTLVVKFGDTLIPLNEDFEPWKTEYNVSLTKEQSKITIEATPKDIQATISGV